MKVFIAFAGPRLKGNTAQLLESFVSGMKSARADIDFVDGKVYQKKINYCRGCEACKTKTGVCVQHDEMFDMYDDIYSSDVLVMAAPTYWFNMSGQLKVFLDRLYGMKAGGMRNKTLVYITTYGDVDEYASGAHNAINSIKEISEYLGVPYEAVYASTGMGSVSKAALEKAFRQGEEVAKSIKK
ncbi:MAG: flavodoxin family protein [Clostridia bacterium]|nr:flavodoxin family protein [Clostridia bacterium]